MTTPPRSRNTPDRMDLPFVGLATFARQPACPDWDRLDGADVAILGIPIDTASSYRVGTRFGPRAIREASMFHGFGPEGVFDFEDEVTYLAADEVRIVDAGDADVIYADTRRSLANAEQAVRALLDARTMPYILGGDHAITMATVAAFSEEQPIHIVHLDAHFDFIDERNGIGWGHGSPMRRASEMAHVTGITTLGPHNMGAVGRRDWEAARAYGTHVASLRQVRAAGAAAVLGHLPEGQRVYVSIDIDAFDPSIAPGTATISHGGFGYYEVKDILREIARRFEVAGVDFVEVSPPYDPSGITALLAARTSLDFIGSIFHERAKRRRQAPEARISSPDALV
ncbi:agmatinase [Labrys monachus]|uniref:Agmatinase n=1 Tax=Labrys monachus TaxID=217067 RepID=A0ABU0FDR4_9HYPH|nr:agmatinase [Labrys monachus]MDQ0392757.1 agmatinase [Labrys monachus]